MKKIVSILCLLIFFSSLTQAKTKTSELHKLIGVISKLKHTLSWSHHKQKTLEQQLKTNETAIGRLAFVMHDSKLQLSKQRKILQQLQRDEINYKYRIYLQRKNLAQLLRAIYMLGRAPTLRLLLNNQNPTKFSRIFRYYDYLQQTRFRIISDLKHTVRKFENNRYITSIHSHELKALAKKQQYDYKQLFKTKQERTQLLTKINHKILSQQQKLQQLLANKKALEKIIARLKTQPISPIFAAPLNKLHKKLSWPAKGKIEKLYGQQIGNSELKWNGDLIDAGEGQNVYAIASGSVVFANWLRGYGLLLIISHGRGYMSLYGRNNSLYKKVGDAVARGELIASVGQSGGYRHSSLYFAIRRNGEPVDPKLWCAN